jgi:hypothetical protein
MMLRRYGCKVRPELTPKQVRAALARKLSGFGRPITRSETLALLRARQEH